MKVCFITNDVDFFVSHRSHIALDLLSDGAEITLIGPKPDSDRGNNFLLLAKMNFVRQEIPHSCFSPISVFRLCFSLRRVLRGLDCEILHGIGVFSALLVLLSGIGLRRKILISIAGLGSTFSHTDIRSMLARVVIKTLPILAILSKSVIIVQNKNDQYLFNRYRRFGDLRIVKIYGSGAVFTGPIQMLQKKNQFNILFVGRILRAKGVLESISAVKELNDRGFHCRLRIAGALDESNVSAVTESALVEFIGGHPAIDWIGHVDNICEEMQECGAVLLPSYREGFPKALVEACAVGRMIIATDVPGCRDLKDICGPGVLLAKKGDVLSLLNELKHFLRLPLEIKSYLGWLNHHNAIQHCDANVVSNAHRKIYREISDEIY